MTNTKDSQPATVRMPVPWIRAKDYRLIQPNSATVSGVEIGGEGLVAIVHFTSHTLSVISEEVPMEVDPKTGEKKQAGQSEYDQQFVKVLEATVKLPPELAGRVANLLLGLFPSFSDETKQKILETIDQHRGT